MAAAAWWCSALLAPVLAFCLPLATATCSYDAKAFPSDLAGTGTVNYASLFDVTYYDSYKVVQYSPTLSTYKNSWPEASQRGQPIPPIVLYQCDTSQPTTSDPGVSANARFYSIPIQRASLPWSGVLHYFELLSVTEAIHLIDMTHISSPCAQLMEECTPGIHLSTRDAGWKATASADSVVFTDSFGSGWSNTTWDVVFDVSLDPGALHRAEWIRFLALFFNEEAQADQIFSKIEVDYNALKGLAQVLRSDSRTEWGGRQPSVVWTSHTAETCADPATNCNGGATKGWTRVEGSWCHCGTIYKISNSHYKRDIVEDAGGRLVPMAATPPAGCSMVSSSDGSQELQCEDAGHESFKQLLVEADAIIDESYVPNHNTFDHDFYAAFSVTRVEIPALAREPPNLFRLDGSVSDARDDGTVGNNWFEQMPAQPQQLLAGMMEVLWSESFDSPCGLKYLRRAMPGEGQTSLGPDDCPFYDTDGDHLCEEIHEYEHMVPACLPDIPSPTPSPEDSTVRGALSIATVLIALWPLSQG